MQLTQHEADGHIVLTITGKCTVEHANALREALLGATAPGQSLVMDLSGVEDTDITFLQLLLATAQTLEKRGANLLRQGTLSPSLDEAARISGFEQTPRLKDFFATDEQSSPGPAA